MKINSITDAPVTENDRIKLIDALRGIALLGILLMNIPGFSMPNYSSEVYKNDQPTSTFGSASSLELDWKAKCAPCSV